jgi:hypothetical protein
MRPALRPLLLVLAVPAYGAVLAVALFFGCSNESPAPPPISDCVPHDGVPCHPALQGGGSQVNGGGVPDGGAGADEGVFSDVNPPPPDANLTPSG